MSVKPIRPSEIKLEETFPDEVISSFNELITENYRNGESSFKSKDVIARIKQKLGTSDEVIYQSNFLDVESLYRKNGWKVKYEQSCYGDAPFDAYFQFTKK
jgi:hypothetical protein